MREVTELEAEVCSISFGYWDDTKECFVPIEDTADIETFVDKFSDEIEGDRDAKSSTERINDNTKNVFLHLIDSLVMYNHTLKESVFEDLESLWERIDDLEEQLERFQSDNR